MSIGEIQQHQASVGERCLDDLPLIPPVSRYFFADCPPRKRLRNDTLERVPLLNYDSSTLNALSKTWTTGLDNQLKNTVGIESQNEQSLDWSKICSKINGASHQLSSREVFTHYCSTLSPAVNQGVWSAEEEKHLLEIVEKHEEHYWSRIAFELSTNRTPFACLQHYQQALNRHLINSDEWSPQEDILLKHAMDEFGRVNPQLVADMIPFRTAPQCLNRWHKLAQREQTTKNWDVNEERMLYLAIVAHDIPCLTSSYSKAEENRVRGRKWLSIARFVNRKDDVQCREKWTNNLDPTIDHSHFTAEEDERLRELVNQHGVNCWTLIAEYLPGRTDAMLRNRWSKLNTLAATGEVGLDLNKKLSILPQKHQRTKKATISEKDFSTTKKVDWKVNHHQ